MDILLYFVMKMETAGDVCGSVSDGYHVRLSTCPTNSMLCQYFVYKVSLPSKITVNRISTQIDFI